jgi:hypothetical protein
METRWLPASLYAWITGLAATLDARQRARFVKLCTGLLFARGRRTVASWLRACAAGRDYKRYYYLDAAQRATSQSPQSLNVLVDGNVVGTIEATGTTYQTESVNFTVAAGQHTITFQGTERSESTELIDAVFLTPVSSQPTPLPTLALNSVPAQSVNEGATVSFTATASGSTSGLTYSLDAGAPAGATIDPVTGVFTWTPTVPGQFSVTVRVSDNSSPPQSDAETVSITVNDVAPAVQLNPALAVTEGATLRDTGSFASATPGSLVADVDYGDGTGLQPLPLGPSGTFVLDHKYTRPGTYTVTVGVQDALGVVGKADLTLTATATALVSGYGRRRDAFVTAHYSKDLERLPDLEELRLWSRRLASRVDRETVARSIWDSREHRKLVRSDRVARIGFERSYEDPSGAERRAIRRDLPPPADALNLRITN